MIEKLITIQNELKAPKNQINSFGGYNYRSCEDILEAVKPLLKKENLTLILTDELVNIGARYYIKATAKLISVDNEIIENIAYAREEETKKGMDGSQITGASSSYARKYALNGLFLIDDVKDSDTTNIGEITKDKALEYKLNFGKYKDKMLKEIMEIDEGYLEYLRSKGDDYIKECVNLIAPLPDPDEQAEILILMSKVNNLAVETNTNLEDITKHYKVESTSKMSKEQLEDCLRILNQKIGE